MSQQFRLLRERRFRPFFLTQFFGAFNDNVFKTALITLVIFRAGQLTDLDGKMLATLLPGLFILPFFLFSATCGQIADKYEKSSLARAVKVFEIGVMLLAAWGFVAHLFWPLVAALFLMGMHSTLFGPLKYAYLPQHLQKDELVGGNGMIEMGTFVAILLGEVLGAWLATTSATATASASVANGNVLIAATVVGIAVLGYWSSRGIPLTPAADPQLKINWNPLTETWRNIAAVRRNRVVWLSILGISWFWFYGATLLAQFPSYAREVLGGDESVFILLLTVFSLGVGSGSLLCERLSARQVEIGLVPFGAIGLTLFGVDLYFASSAVIVAAGTPPVDFRTFLGVAHHWRVLVDIVLLGLFGGFYIVPMYALILTRSAASHRSRVVAANNIMNALFMVVSALVSMFLFKLGLSIPELFLATALFSVVVAIYIYMQVPEYLLRFIFWTLTHSVFRLRAQGVEHIPEQGPALLVATHPNVVDMLIIAAASPRPIRFVVDSRLFKGPILNFVFHESRAIPASADTEAEVARALADGELVGIFSEGDMSKSGQVESFRSDLTRIIETSPVQPVPLVPLSLTGQRHGVCSYPMGLSMTTLMSIRPLRAVRLVIGVPLASQKATPERLRDLIAAIHEKTR